MLQVLRWCRVVSQRSGKYENCWACTYLCVYVQISPRWETLPYAFFFFENFPSLSLHTCMDKMKKTKSSSCLLFDGVAHLDNKEVNLVRGQLLTSHFWYFAAPPEPDEQKQCRFHPPCPIAVQRETVGNRHKAPFQECCICVFSFSFSALTTEHLQNFSFTSHSETAHKKCLCAAAHKHWLCWGSCIAPQPWGPEDCAYMDFTPVSPHSNLWFHLGRNKWHMPTCFRNPICSEVKQLENKNTTLLTWGKRPLFQHHPLSGRSKQMANENQAVVVSNWQG